MQPSRTDVHLARLLRLIGVCLVAALPAILLPYTVMNALHRDALHLGELPDVVILQYLSRTASLLYAMHGAILVFVSFDVRRYRPLIVVLGYLNGFYGLVAFTVDLVFGMPLWWAAWEGPLIILAAVLTIRLAKRDAADSSELAQVS
ncbi:hypothetical protein [Limnoglobus roseus]|uniref:hypothetical protein n=1 Tax=Limnoglobus roseus TaxID=2598579 RepID=UPI0011EB4FD4|nr:hypothetical protein [Limnoglobus roseus]